MKLFRLILISVFIFFINNSSAAQESNDELKNALQSTLDSLHNLFSINGLSSAIQLPDNSVWASASGISTFTPEDSLSSDHIFATGSTAKTLTAMCILQLVDENVLSLDDSLSNWLPDYENINSTITIKQLLRHESGVNDFFQNPNFQPTLFQNTDSIWTAESALIEFSQPQLFEPGANWAYSNTNYLLLKMVVENATNNTFESELRSRFFIPYGLDSFINPAIDTVREPYAHLWLDANNDGMVEDVSESINNWRSLFSIISPAAGYFSTPTDLAIWMKLSMSGQLLNQETWDEATNTSITNLPNNIRYGFGIMESEYLGHQSFGHGGDLSYSTQSHYFPELDISISLIANDARVTSWALIPGIRALLKTYLDYKNISTSTTLNPQATTELITYPNPFREEINFTFKSSENFTDCYIKVTAMDGKVVLKKNITMHSGENKLSIPIEQLKVSSGKYLLQIFSKNNLIAQKQIIRQ